LQFEIYNVIDNFFPYTPEQCDAWIITGSHYSVYDEIDWINKLKEFVRRIASSNKLCIGVCFGHQMIGDAMGGVVKKAEIGWCVGVHEFEVIKKEIWMNPYQSKVNLLMSCQDQVIVLPKNGEVLAQTTDCPVGIFQIGNKMLGIQGHPEFSVPYVKSLIEDRTNRIGDDKVRKGIESLNHPIHSSIVGDWMDRFLNK